MCTATAATADSAELAVAEAGEDAATLLDGSVIAMRVFAAAKVLDCALVMLTGLRANEEAAGAAGFAGSLTPACSIALAFRACVEQWGWVYFVHLPGLCVHVMGR